MARKSDATPTAETPRRRVAKNETSPGGASVSASRALDGGRPQGLRASASLRLKSSSLLNARVIYCGDNLEQLGPCRTGQCWGETKEKRAFEDRHENTKAYIDYMRPRCVQLARVLKKTGSLN